MRICLLAALASALISSLASAQLVLCEEGPLTSAEVYLHDVAGSPYTSVPTGAGNNFTAVAADEAASVLYLVRNVSTTCTGPELLRWPYGDTSPTLVGCLPSFGTRVDDLTFGNGKLYGVVLNLCRSLVFEMDPTNPAGATVLYDAGGGLAPGIAFDPATGNLLLYRTMDFSSPCAPGPSLGIKSLDLSTGVESLLVAHPSGTSGDYGGTPMTVGSGRLWLANAQAPIFDNLDLTSLTWDSTPPANTVPPGTLTLYWGVAWAPSFTNSPAELGSVYCDSNPNSSGNTATLSSSGSDVVADNNLEFLMTDGPANRFGYYLMSATQGFIPLFAGSQGNFCLGSPFVRFNALGQLILPDGTFPFSPNLTSLPQLTVINPGETWNFQVWFRDVMSNSNTSNGYEILFQ